MKQKTPEQELELLRKNLLHERAIWECINENGCMIHSGRTDAI